MDKNNRAQILRSFGFVNNAKLVDNDGNEVTLPKGYKLVIVANDGTDRKPYKGNALGAAEKEVDNGGNAFKGLPVDNRIGFAGFYSNMVTDDVIDIKAGIDGFYVKSAPVKLTPYEAWIQEAAFKIKLWVDSGKDRDWLTANLPAFYQYEATAKGFNWVDAMTDFNAIIDRLVK